MTTEDKLDILLKIRKLEEYGYRSPINFTIDDPIERLSQVHKIMSREHFSRRQERLAETISAVSRFITERVYRHLDIEIDRETRELIDNNSRFIRNSIKDLSVSDERELLVATALPIISDIMTKYKPLQPMSHILS